MSSRSTLIFKSIDDLDLKVDIIYPSSLTGLEQSQQQYFTSTVGALLVSIENIFLLISLDPVYFGIGSLLAQIVVSCLKLVPKICAYLSYISKPHLSPPPVAVFIYYGCPTFHDPKNHFSNSKTLFNETPYPEPRFAYFLASPPSINPTPSFFLIFNPSSLLSNFSRDPAYKPLPKGEFEDRSSLFLWLVQENKLSELWKSVDQGLESEVWIGFGKTIIVYGDQDELIPYYMAKQGVDVIGLHDAQLFTAIGRKHGWDMPLFLGDPGLKEIEEALEALDEIIFKSQGGPLS
ncbi:hypothetical protein BPOR_0274g00070 [Botrytis porri]|uniref:Uncharacterized protein n=1 Tax=Botrytis porri TaxID=87229 RepID=A0A4Z1KN91_9HELO|nr:hypothetical protein BPOR_0274g00070 [Botrytis porri]